MNRVDEAVVTLWVQTTAVHLTVPMVTTHTTHNFNLVSISAGGM